MKELILWIDLETTGLSPLYDSVLEIGAILTDLQGKIVADGFTSLIHEKRVEHLLDESNEYVKKMHDRSGLWEDLYSCSSRISVEEAEQNLLSWIKENSGEGTTFYLGGNSVHTDKGFIDLKMKELSSLLSHRIIDCTALNIFFSRVLNQEIYPGKSFHRAYSDIVDSVEEYQRLVRAASLL